MALYNAQSLQLLKDKIDLIEVISSHIKLQRSGGYYKACCPFHEEKSPSFMIQAGDTHYHCFGCGAHGDAIAFLMGYLKLGFKEAVEYLAEKFQVPLEVSEEESPTTSKKLLKEVLYKACRFYHFCLLHTSDGHEALAYLYNRGIDREFIERFQLGYSLKGDAAKKFLLSLGYEEKLLLEAGLLGGAKRDFFQERVMIPIQDALGQVIGFTARKIHDSTFGGKYINTSETPLFKKSHVLFGLNYSRSKIAKEKKAIIVEGQIDALRLIQAGFDYTVAGQGTAFGEGHVKELLNLGVETVYLAFDDDDAGRNAAVKVGHLFQKKGVDVELIKLEDKMDPDSFIRKKGREAFEERIKSASNYLPFLFETFSAGEDLSLPAKKNALVEEIAKRIKDWEHPVLVYESLKKLCKIAEVPETVLGMRKYSEHSLTPTTKASPSKLDIDGDKILEVDLLRWVLIALQQEEGLFSLIEKNITKDSFINATCQSFYLKLLELKERKISLELMSLGSYLEEKELAILSEIAEKRVNRTKAKEGIVETLSKVLNRNWMQEREKVKKEIESSPEERQFELSKKLSLLIKNPPTLSLHES